MSCRCAERELRVSRVDLFLQGNFHFLEATYTKRNKNTLDLRALDTAQCKSISKVLGSIPRTTTTKCVQEPEVRTSGLELL